MESGTANRILKSAQKPWIAHFLLAELNISVDDDMGGRVVVLETLL